MFSFSCLCVMATGLLCNSMLPVVSFLHSYVCKYFMRIKKPALEVVTVFSKRQEIAFSKKGRACKMHLAETSDNKAALNTSSMLIITKQNVNFYSSAR